MILMGEAKTITSFFKSFRKTYQEVFIEDHIKLNEETINLLPVKTSNTIAKYFSEALDAKVILRTVSDRPRNVLNLANAKEMEIIDTFKNNQDKKYIFKENNNYVYQYYEPLYITKRCINCHGKKEDAPLLIQERYNSAFGYKLGDLRGIISLEIDKDELLTAIDTENTHDKIYTLVNIMLLVITILILYFKLKKNNEESRKILLNKNTLLERKAEEFHSLQSALGKSEIISTSDIHGVITSVNDKFCEVSGYTEEELLGSSHNIIRHPDTKAKVFKKMWNTIKNKQVFKTLIKNKRKDGSSYHVDTTIVPILDEDGEITEYLALRHYVEDMMNHKLLLQDIIKSFDNCVLIIAKLEGFDEFEELYTTEVITKLEAKFLHMALGLFPKGCNFNKVYKLENGEFAFIEEMDANHGSTEDELANIKVFQDNVKRSKFVIDGYEFNPSVLISYSIGSKDIFENVKLGLKKLLKENKTLINANGLSAQVKKTAEKNLHTIQTIKKAIDTKNIVSYFQAIYNNQDKKIEKYESLVRLIDKDNNIISPYFFLETAKKAKYYNYITRIVIDNSFKAMDTVAEDITINLSFLDIEDDKTREYLYQKIDTCAQAQKLTIELLEDETAKEFELIQAFIQKIKAQGVKIAIDDFGAGYSNFERLLELQPDILKIDGSLIKNIDTDAYSRSIVETVQEFANRENIQTVAEFVHSKEIFDIVNEIGIDYTQGYYIAQPKPMEELS